MSGSVTVINTKATASRLNGRAERGTRHRTQIAHVQSKTRSVLQEVSNSALRRVRERFNGDGGTDEIASHHHLLCRNVQSNKMSFVRPSMVSVSRFLVSATNHNIAETTATITETGVSGPNTSHKERVLGEIKENETTSTTKIRVLHRYCTAHQQKWNKELQPHRTQWEVHSVDGDICTIAKAINFQRPSIPEGDGLVRCVRS